MSVVFWNVLSIITTLIDTIIFFKFFSALLLKRFNEKWTYVAIVGVTLFVYAQGLLSETYVNINLFLMISRLFLTFLFFAWFFKGSIIKKIVAFFAMLVGMMAAEAVTLGMLLLIFKLPPQVFSEDTVYRLIGIILSKLLAFMGITIYIQRRKSQGGIILKKNFMFEMFLMLFVNVILIVIIIPFLQTMNMSAPEVITPISIIILGIGVVNFSSFMLLDKVIEDSKHEVSMLLEIETLGMQHEYIQEFNKMSMEMRGLRHDMVNHFGSIKTLLELKKYDAVYKFVTEIVDETSKAQQLVVLNNIAVGALLNRKMQETIEKSIPMTCNVSDLDQCSVNDLDLSIILANLLDNAIEASLKLPEKERLIALNIKMKSEYLSIDVINNTNGIYSKEGARYVTTKEDKVHHGIGLQNVRRIANKYNGELLTNPLETTFVANVMLHRDADASHNII